MFVRSPARLIRSALTFVLLLIVLYATSWQLVFVLLSVANGSVAVMRGGLTGLASLWWEALPSMLQPGRLHTREIETGAVVLTVLETTALLIARAWWREREKRRRYGPHVNIGPGGGKPEFRRAKPPARREG